MTEQTEVKNFVERRVYGFLCKCGRQAKSFKRAIAKAGQCRKCRYGHGMMDERQQALL